MYIDKAYTVTLSGADTRKHTSIMTVCIFILVVLLHFKFLIEYIQTKKTMTI